MIKRYNHMAGRGVRIFESEQGEFIKHKDYEKQINFIKQKLNELSEQSYGFHSHEKMQRIVNEILNNLEGDNDV